MEIVYQLGKKDEDNKITEVMLNYTWNKSIQQIFIEHLC